MYQIIFTLEGSKLIIRFRGIETEELRKLTMVLSVFVNIQLDALAEGLVELGEVVFVFNNLADGSDKVQGLLHKVLADDLEDFVCWRVTGDVKRKIFRVDDTLDEVEVLGNEVLTVIMMNTRRTYLSLMLLRFLYSKRLKRAL
jgi:hypothetical protein